MKNLLLYISGYIDGDGCIYLGTFSQGKITVYESSIQITSVKEAVLKEFQSNFGGAIRLKPFRPKHKDAHCWTLKGPRAVLLIQAIQPYIVEKRVQCELFIKFNQSIKDNNFRTVSHLVIKQRDDLINQIRREKHMNNHVTREEIEALKNEANTITPIENDYPYLAGLIDAEGCFRIKTWKPKNRPNQVYNITVEVGNTKLPVLPWLVKRFGSSVIYIEGKGNSKPLAKWTLSAAALYAILPKIRPYLRNKQDVCDKLIEFHQTILPNGGALNSMET